MNPGTVIAQRYRVIRLIGQGGMGAVYEAEHVAVGRKVAVKILHERFANDESAIERFEREARSAGGIGHPNIIDVIDFGMHGSDPYMVTELLTGQSLATLLEHESRLSIERACGIMVQILAALSAAHTKGIVHRDLKPENVFLVARGAQADFVKLLDFGIAKVATSGRGLTKSGTLVGTPDYMSPEQATAKADLDARSDIYSAGVILYEMLTGKVPFDAESETEVLIKICTRGEEPRWPREIDLSIPEPIDSAVRSALAFERSARYQTAGEMLDVLAPYAAASGLVPDYVTGSFKAVSLPRDSFTDTPAAWSTQSRPRRVSQATRAEASPAPSRGKSVSLVAGGLAILVLASVAVFGMRRGARHVAARPAEPAPAWVQIDIDGLPSGGRLLVDGQVSVDGSIRARRGSHHHVRAEAPGHQSYDADVIADRDQSVHLALAPSAPLAPPALPSVAAASATVPLPVQPRAHAHGSRRSHAGEGSARGNSGGGGLLLAPTAEY